MTALGGFSRRSGLYVGAWLAVTIAANAQDCRIFQVRVESLNVSAEAREDANFIDVIDNGQTVCVTKEAKVGGQDWVYVASLVKDGSERQPIDGWVPLKALSAAVPVASKPTAPPSPNVQAAGPASPNAAAPAATASQDALNFRDPIPFGPYPVSGQSIEALAKGKPLFPPFEGLEDSMWKQSCTSCHIWEQTSLCEQGGRYAANPRLALRIPHPYGGAYKIALMRWFKGGCH